MDVLQSSTSHISLSVPGIECGSPRRHFATFASQDTTLAGQSAAAGWERSSEAGATMSMSSDLRPALLNHPHVALLPPLLAIRPGLAQAEAPEVSHFLTSASELEHDGGASTSAPPAIGSSSTAAAALPQQSAAAEVAGELRDPNAAFERQEFGGSHAAGGHIGHGAPPNLPETVCHEDCDPLDGMSCRPSLLCMPTPPPLLFEVVGVH